MPLSSHLRRGVLMLAAAVVASPALVALSEPTPVTERVRTDVARGARLIARMRDVDRRLTPEWRYCWNEDESRVLAYVPGMPGARVLDTVTRGAATLNVDVGRGAPEMAFADGQRIVFYAGGSWWAIDAPAGACRELDAKASQEADARWDIRRHAAEPAVKGRATLFVVRNDSGRPLELFWREAADRCTSYGRIEDGASREQNSYVGHRWELREIGGGPLESFTVPDEGGLLTVTGRKAAPPDRAPEPVAKPAAPAPAFVTEWRDGRLLTTPAGGAARPVAMPGLRPGERVYATYPDATGGTVVALVRDDPPVRKLTYTEAKPKGGGPPREFTFAYAKPGDRIAQRRATTIDAVAGREVPVDAAMFADLWELRPLGWSPVTDEFLLHLHYRTHKLSRIVALGRDGALRTIVEERADTFIDYSQKTVIEVLPKSGHLLWASERDGRNRLYRYDIRSGRLLNTVTPGPGILHSVEYVDEDAGTVDLVMLAVNAGEDPYHRHLVRRRLDGAGEPLVITRGDGMHSWRYSPSRRHLVDTWSRMDMPPSVALRDARTGDTLLTLTTGDLAAVPKGYPVPERFVAKGRDGKTDIYGVIFRPAGYKLGDRLPVIEWIYAGPHDFHVPKSWRTRDMQMKLAELGYAVVCIDGMGTNWRDRAFHDVCHKNIRDAGYPDRIAWIKAAAKAHPELDITKVGVIGGSAGGQNAAAALIWQSDFYKVAVADCGCHDNRIDKIWWNEAWMGWPVDASYAANSNIEHAAGLRGELLLLLGEIDTNVDVESTYRFSEALTKAGKPHELCVVPGGGHFVYFDEQAFLRVAAFLRRYIPVS